MMIEELLVGIILCLHLRRWKFNKIMVYSHERCGGCAATIGGNKGRNYSVTPDMLLTNPRKAA